MHVEKFKAAAVGGVLAHILRKLTADKLPRNFSNENVDKSKRHLNYRLDSNASPFDAYKSILARDNVKVQKRKDLNTFCSVCLTLPDDVKPEDEKRFFQLAYEFLRKRYAPFNNVVIAEVHKDETAGEHPGRPHMHFVFVPLVLDEKHKKKTKQERHKVCVKEVITLADLKTLHQDCDKYMAQELGYRVSILNDEAVELEANKTKDAIVSLKNILRSNAIKDLPAKKYKETKDLITQIIAVIEEDQKEYDKLVDDYNALVEEYNNLDDEIAQLEAQKAKIKKEILTLEGEDFSIGNIRDDNYIDL